MNWKAILKTIGVAAGAAALNQAADVLSTQTGPLAHNLAPVLAVVGAYLLRRPWETKPE